MRKKYQNIQGSKPDIALEFNSHSFYLSSLMCRVSLIDSNPTRSLASPLYQINYNSVTAYCNQEQDY